jgi:CelD/BcsL family acetyltransferase involved in cellulose biosynthesis
MVSFSASDAALPAGLGRDGAGQMPVRIGCEPEREILPATFEVVRSRSGLDALERDWNDLFCRSGKGHQLFQTFNWNWHWANHYLAPEGSCANHSLAIVTVRRAGRLIMLWPLTMERTAGFKVLRWMGEPVSQYGDVLAEELSDQLWLMQRTWRFLTSRLRADAICLRKVRADAAVAPLMRALNLRQTALEKAPYLDLASAPNFTQYELRYGAKARKNRRRLARRLAERGPMALERHREAGAACAAAAQAIILKRQWIKHTGRLSQALADRRFAAFFADVAHGRGRPAGCSVTVLRCNGQPAGIAIDVTCGTHRAAHVIVHDPRLDSCGPGTLLLEARIKDAIVDGIASFDLLAPAYAYKLDWADGAIAVGDFALGLTLAGRTYVHLCHGMPRRTAKAAAEALPPLLSRLRSLTGLITSQPQGPQERGFPAS